MVCAQVELVRQRAVQIVLLLVMILVNFVVRKVALSFVVETANWLVPAPVGTLAMVIATRLVMKRVGSSATVAITDVRVPAIQDVAITV